MSKEELFALENLLLALRKGRLTAQAVEGLCKGSAHFSELGEAFQRGDLDVADLEALIGKVKAHDSSLTADQEYAKATMEASFAPGAKTRVPAATASPWATSTNRGSLFSPMVPAFPGTTFGPFLSRKPGK